MKAHGSQQKVSIDPRTELALRVATEGMYASGVPYRVAVRIFQRHFLMKALGHNGDNARKTAAVIGIHRNTLAHHCDLLDLYVTDSDTGDA